MDGGLTNVSPYSSTKFTVGFLVTLFNRKDFVRIPLSSSCRCNSSNSIGPLPSVSNSINMYFNSSLSNSGLSNFISLKNYGLLRLLVCVSFILLNNFSKSIFCV
jgi:hypothetical protein